METTFKKMKETKNRRRTSIYWRTKSISNSYQYFIFFVLCSISGTMAKYRGWRDIYQWPYHTILMHLCVYVFVLLSGHSFIWSIEKLDSFGTSNSRALVFFSFFLGIFCALQLCVCVCTVHPFCILFTRNSTIDYYSINMCMALVI